MADFKKIMGRKIKGHRVIAGLTQYDLSNLVDVSRVTIMKWEGGVTEPKASDLVRIAAALGITVSELVAEAEPAQTA